MSQFVPDGSPPSQPGPADPNASPPCSVIQQAVLNCVETMGLPPGSAVLDAPCGAGSLAVALNQAGFECRGADLDASAQEWLGERFHTVDLNASLPWPDSTFALVVSVEGIEHLENRFAFLQQAHRILQEKGRLLLTTPNTVSLRSRVRFLGSGFFHRDPRPLLESGRHPLHHIGLLTYPELRYSLHTSGFCIEKVSHTHSKPVSYLYAPYIPWMWLYTLIAFRKEKDPEQRRRNQEIRKTLGSRSLLFGENLMVLARKV